MIRATFNDILNCPFIRELKHLLRYGGSSYGGGGGRGTAAAAAAASGYHAGSSPGPADLYAATEYVQQATSPQPQSNGYQMQMNRVSNRTSPTTSTHTRLG